VEERVLARARQKMVLDALVIKKRGSDGGLADALVDEGEDEEEMAKLSVEELWNMLSEGATKVFDPAVDKAEDYDAEDYDRLICEAKPAKWDDKTGGGNSNEKSSVEGHNQSELDGTIFAPVRVDSSSSIEVVDLLSSGDETSDEPAAAIMSIQQNTTPQNVRRGKRTRAPATKFEANVWEQSTKKKAKIRHDSKCFRCCKRVVKDSQVPPKTLQRSVKTVSRNDPNAPLECIACPRVYHLACSGERERPKTRSWYCPWHACVTCKRKSSDVGGMLFHCVSCPLTYCFDCSPDEHTEGGQSTSAVALSLTASLERRGMAHLKSYMFFTCGDCKTNKHQNPFTQENKAMIAEVNQSENGAQSYNIAK
jgi:hypothetical protein